MIVLAFVMSAPGWIPIAGAQNTGSTASPPVVSEQANLLLKEMAAYIGSADQFTFHADITFDHVLPSGQNLQFSAAEDVAMQRPSGLYVEWGGDLGDRQFWYDGKSVTLYDPATPFYASESAPSRIDEMLDTLVPHLNFSPPLADLVYSDPYQRVRGNIQYGFDLGVTDVDGQSCHALAFVEKDIDWQIWISAGPQPVPCKVMITYKTQPSQPQFMAVFTNWDFDPRIAPAIFTPVLPVGAQKIPFQTVAAAK